jgi:hypothetical protein
MKGENSVHISHLPESLWWDSFHVIWPEQQKLQKARGLSATLTYLLTAHSFRLLIREPSHAHEPLQLRNKAGSPTPTPTLVPLTQTLSYTSFVI